MSKSFEQLMQELESLVMKMESGALPLEELIQKYEEANKIHKECRDKLNIFQKKIEILNADDGEKGQWIDFEPENSRDSSKNELF